MKNITQEMIELIRLTSVDLSPDVEFAIKKETEKEVIGSGARDTMETIQDNIRLARENSTPICQDTGTLLFYIHYPEGWSPRLLRQQVVEAVVEATKLNYLRPNTVNAITGKNTGNNLGDEFHPTTHFEEVLGDELTIDLILKGGGCENVGCQYRLPEARVGASRDLDGVRKVVLDAVHQAQGKGCAPGILGVAIGGDRGSSYLASKEVFLRKMDEENSIPELADLEARITEEANQLGIGPMGFGGKTTLLKTMIKGMHRIPACYFVSVSYMCWAYRRRRMIIKNDHVIYQ